MTKTNSQIPALFWFLLSFCLVGCGKDSIKPVNNDTVSDIGLFSVSATQKVAFAPGNLAEGWRSFVDNQWDLGGYFGWGSGNHPSDTSTDYHDYVTFDDWGNHIEGGWRTMTYDELYYILFSRESAEDKHASGIVNNRHGLILLPDNWTMPDSCQFIPGENGWTRNWYSLQQWQKMEAAGAVFLRAGGYRWGSNTFGLSVGGNYWLATRYDENDAHYMYFDENLVNWQTITNLAAGMQVRLIRNRN